MSAEYQGDFRLGPGGSTVGFFGTDPQDQPTANGDKTTVAPGTTTNPMYLDTTYTGGIGTTAYTVGDIVAALKTLGLIES